MCSTLGKNVTSYLHYGYFGLSHSLDKIFEAGFILHVDDIYLVVFRKLENNLGVVTTL